MARPTDEELLLREIPENGDVVGNYQVMRKLDWEYDKYFRVRNPLVEKGVLAMGRGRGGSVRRAQLAPAGGQPTNSPATTPQPSVGGRSVIAGTPPETALYEPITRVLRKEWALDERLPLETLHVEETAKQGRRATGGTWTRPDITAISVRTFPHVPGKFVDVWTFEIKAAEALDVTGIFEAAAHARSATRSYALLQISDDLDPDKDPLIKRCEDEARRLGVGLVTFVEPGDFETWTTLVRAPQLHTDPQLLEDFISGQLPEGMRAKLLRWTK
jgi:hypothetical protein